MDARGNILYLVVPCYNEEDGLEHAAGVMAEKLERLMRAEKISQESRILLVDDGSRDNT